jgi:hypothetical protein
MPAIVSATHSHGAEPHIAALFALTSSVHLILVSASPSSPWWLDPVIGLIAALAVKGGLEAWRGKGCCVAYDDCCA